MGKKKASKSKKLRPILQQYIDKGLIYVRTKPKEYYNTLEFYYTPAKKFITVYEVAFGADNSFTTGYFNNECVLVTVYQTKDRISSWHFLKTKIHMLDSVDEQWLSNQLSEILTMYMLGAYQSDQKSTILPSTTLQSMVNTAQRKAAKK